MLNDVKELHRKIDVSQLPIDGGGYMPYNHEDFVSFVKVGRPSQNKRSIDSSYFSFCMFAEI